MKTRIYAAPAVKGLSMFKEKKIKTAKDAMPTLTFANMPISRLQGYWLRGDIVYFRTFFTIYSIVYCPGLVIPCYALTANIPADARR